MLIYNSPIKKKLIKLFKYREKRLVQVLLKSLSDTSLESIEKIGRNSR